MPRRELDILARRERWNLRGYVQHLTRLPLVDDEVCPGRKPRRPKATRQYQRAVHHRHEVRRIRQRREFTLHRQLNLHHVVIAPRALDSDVASLRSAEELATT